MVAREYCESPWFRWFLSTVEVIPVNRGGIDTAATKAAIRYVQEGGLVGMFPEGRINVSDELMLPVRPGAVLVALKAGAPIVPCWIEGSPYGGTAWSPFFLSARVRLRFAAPVDPNEIAVQGTESERLAQLMVAVIQRIASLAGQPKYQPRFAGRRWKP
jgi:1-acyl-sn-glycerol-3-phosphate acyltransferase